VGLLFLIVVYGLILSFGAKTISDGSEGLLDLFPSWGSVIGALLLPVLGALPDSAIIIVSGAFGSVAEAQQQLAVGVGTLAGSTIMLLTFAWFASVMVGKCDFDSLGEAIDEKNTKFSLTKQGISVDVDTQTNAKIMIITSFSYLIIQGVAFAYLSDPDGTNARKIERPFTLTCFIICTIFLLAYCVYQMLVPSLTKKTSRKIGTRTTSST